jgi:hypothetical protein
MVILAFMTIEHKPAPARHRAGPSPFLIAVGVGLAAVLLAFVPTLWRMATVAGPAPVAAAGAPWQVDVQPGGGIRVFGLALPGSTLGEARARWGDELKLAVMAGPGEGATLEGYVEQFSAAGLNGRLLLSFEAGADRLATWRSTQAGVPLEGGGRRHALPASALAGAEALPLAGLSLIPAAQLDAAVLRERFGEPAERIAEGERLEHWMYPSIGLAVALDAEGKDLLQYVAPADFERRLRAPLMAR